MLKKYVFSRVEYAENMTDAVDRFIDDVETIGNVFDNFTIEESEDVPLYIQVQYDNIT